MIKPKVTVGLAPPKHTCRFTIPVEWKVSIQGYSREIRIDKATKLRCECGKETSR